MCVIIDKPAGVSFSKKDLEIAYENNPDGFGLMYRDSFKKKLIVHKTVDWDLKKILETFKSLKDERVCFHFRYKTRGKINNDQCHPYEVVKDKLYFMHNGTILKAKEEGEDSDSQGFNKNFLQPILELNPSLIKLESFQQLITSFVGTTNKLCFMNDKGEVFKINESKGHDREGCWVSNLYSFNKNYRRSGGSTGYVYTGSSNTWSNEQELLLGFQKLEKGMTVSVFSDEVADFYKEGIVADVFKSTCRVTLKDNKGVDRTLTFYLDNGNLLTVYHNLKGLYITPSFSFEQENPRETVKKFRSKHKDKVLLVPKDDEEKKETTKNALVSSRGDVWGGVEFKEDADDGLFLEKVLYEGLSFEAFNEKTLTEKAAWFADHLEASFNMLVDLVEDICERDIQFIDECSYSYGDEDNQEKEEPVLKVVKG